MNSEIASPDSRVAVPVSRWRSLLFFWGMLALLLGVDQLTKYWAISYWQHQSMWSAWGDCLRFTYAENPGAFLSLGADLPAGTRFAVMVVMNGGILLFIAGLLVFHPTIPAVWRWGLGLILTGGTGNMIDRLLHQGHVIDFLNVGLGPVRSGIFNVADMYLSFGLFWIACCLFFRENLQENFRENPASEPEEIHHENPAETKAKEVSGTAERASGIGLLLLMLSAYGFVAAATAEVLADSVIYRAGPRGGHVAMNGDILDFNQKEMVFRSKSPETVQHLPTSQIVTFEAFFQPDHQAAEEALQKNELLQAKSLVEKVLRTEQRSWVRRELMALLIRIAVNQQQWTMAATHYKAMLDSDPHTRHQDLLPLFWQTESLAAIDREFAIRELSSPRPEFRLIAASWLLKEQGWQQQATEVLNELLYSPIPHIRNLARSQLWRLRLAAEDFNDGDLVRWERQLLELPENMQAGPMFLLGAGYERQVQPEQAAARYLWITVMDARQLALARNATERAATLLESLGQLTAAGRLRKESAERFQVAGQ